MIEEAQKDIADGINVYMVSTTGEQEWIDHVPEIQWLKAMDIYDTNSIAQMYRELSAMQTSTIRIDESLSKASLIPFIILLVIGVLILGLILGETRYRKIP